MTLEHVYYVSQILSTIALAMSLIYLSLQTHQTGRNQIAQMHQARNELFHQYTLKLTDPEFGPLARAGFRADPALDEEQIHRFYFYTSTILRFFEEIYRQWQEGMIADERWTTTKKSMAGILRMPGFRASYKALRGTLDPGFVTLADGFIEKAKGSAVIDPVADWLAAAAEERATEQADRNEAQQANRADVSALRAPTG